MKKKKLVVGVQYLLTVIMLSQQDCLVRSEFEVAKQIHTRLVSIGKLLCGENRICIITWHIEIPLSGFLPSFEQCSGLLPMAICILLTCDRWASFAIWGK